MRKVIAGLAVVALVAGVALVALSVRQAPSALAQETEDEVFNQPLRDVLDDLVEDNVITEEQADKIASALENRFFRFGRSLHHTPHLDTVAEVLGMEVDDLAAQLRDGATIAEIAGDKTPEVIDALVAEQDARIDDAVEDGRLSEEEAEDVRSALTERITAMVNGEYGLHMGGFPFDTPRFSGPREFGFHGPGGFEFHGPRGFGFRFHGGFQLEDAADAIGITLEELLEQLQDGKSIAEVAEDEGVDPQDVIGALVADIDERLDNAVADERLTREQADEIRAMAVESITAMVNGESNGLRFEFRFDVPEEFGRFRGPGRGHHMWPFGDNDGEDAGTSA